jgi:phosphotriesterase-related protein
MHEHIPVDQAGDHAADAYHFAVKELKRARSLGLDSIVEVSPRRDIAALRRASLESGIQVIACTGFYTDLTTDERGFSVDQFRAHMLTEIEHGIDGSGVFPGVIKAASANTVPDAIETRLLIAAARVQAETGLPLCLHSVTGCQRQQQILADSGANLSKCYFSHVEAVFGWEGRGLEEQIDLLAAVVAQGSYLCYNNFGNWAHTPAQTLARILHTLRQRGFLDRQFATMDVTWSYPQGKRQILWEDINPGGERRTYAYLLSDVIPWLAEQGLDPAEARQLIESNPRRIFAD